MAIAAIHVAEYLWGKYILANDKTTKAMTVSGTEAPETDLL